MEDLCVYSHQPGSPRWRVWAFGLDVKSGQQSDQVPGFPQFPLKDCSALGQLKAYLTEIQVEGHFPRHLCPRASPRGPAACSAGYTAAGGRSGS